ncbi:MAG: hypothetical protein KKA19_03280 [Candidatus Margulisbacteria bacterium]|nr:hypothetical protein [Candidatus Margulisiibacteriota bacterium]
MIKKLLVIFCLLAVSAMPVMAELGLKVSTKYTSRYIWRGYDVGDLTGLKDGSEGIENNVGGEMISLDYGLGGGFNFNLWGYLANHVNQFEEVDLTLVYGFSLTEGIDTILGYTHYTFPTLQLWNERNEVGRAGKRGYMYGATADEIFIGLSLTKVFLAPTITWYREYAQGWNDEYWNIAGGDSLDIFGGIDYSLAAGYWCSRARIAHIDVGISKTFKKALAGFDITPAFTYIALPDTAENPGVQPGNAQLNDQINAHEMVFSLDFSKSF